MEKNNKTSPLCRRGGGSPAARKPTPRRECHRSEAKQSARIHSGRRPDDAAVRPGADGKRGVERPQRRHREGRDSMEGRGSGFRKRARLRNVRRAPPHSSCARLVLERHLHTHPFFPLLPSLHPLPLVTPDLVDSAPSPSPSGGGGDDDDDPFLPAGFVSAFSAFSLERHPVLARSASAFSGLLAELERALAVESAASSTPDPAGPMVFVDRLRAYLQIVDVTSILRLDRDIADHAFELFKDCSSATCLRNRSVEALATAALVQAIREAQEPRTLQVCDDLLFSICSFKCSRAE
ncbi:hypothetical protein GUJ93_ZPchr0009g2388 [Zizania palustris]|uniref:Transcription factor TFIIB cyclin-like domain-containing protein n=1 Tax=Zizania palustris TaxID=103762 RepID=A0A8J5UXI3_ZIZPA|nr:hypothetical protein GUJ93_ZPchr0009g2388 [Zizania palustris]